jgi:hypothetical protein
MSKRVVSPDILLTLAYFRVMKVSLYNDTLEMHACLAGVKVLKIKLITVSCETSNLFDRPKKL